MKVPRTRLQSPRVVPSVSVPVQALEEIRMAEIQKDEWFIVQGQIAYVAEVGEDFRTQYDRRDSFLNIGQASYERHRSGPMAFLCLNSERQGPKTDHLIPADSRMVD
jgi:hypothetical protein